MDSKKINNILEQYYQGISDLSEEKELENYFVENGENMPDDASLLMYFREEKENLKYSAFKQEIPLFQIPSKKVISFSQTFYRCAAAVAIFVAGFSLAWVIQRNSIVKNEIAHLQQMVHQYEQLSVNSNPSFLSDRLTLMSTLINDPSLKPEYIEKVIQDEDELHVKTSAIYLIDKKYGRKFALQLLGKLFEAESNPKILVAFLKIFIDLDPIQSKRRAKQLLEKNTINIETREAVQILTS